MKFTLLVLGSVFLGSSALADSYVFSVQDPNPGKLILAKNCLDYTGCGGRSSGLSGDEQSGYRLDAFIDLDAEEFSDAMKACNFSRIGVPVEILNLTKNSSVAVPADNGIDATIRYPDVEIPEDTREEKQAKFDRIKALIAQDHMAAIRSVITEYNLSTGGYELKLAPKLGSAGAVTDHETKTITFAESGVFWSPCVLVQAVRHELEHVYQYAQVERCSRRGKSHNMDDHYTRERSAYMNDIRNIPTFCPDERVSNHLVTFFTKTFLERYFKNRVE